MTCHDNAKPKLFCEVCGDCLLNDATVHPFQISACDYPGGDAAIEVSLPYAYDGAGLNIYINGRSMNDDDILIYLSKKWDDGKYDWGRKYVIKADGSISERKDQHERD